MNHRVLVRSAAAVAAALLAPTLAGAQSTPTELNREFLTEEEAAGIEQRNADRNRELAAREALRTVADPNARVDRGVDGAPGSSRWSAGTRCSPRARGGGAARLARGAAARGGRFSTDHYDQLDLGDRRVWVPWRTIVPHRVQQQQLPDLPDPRHGGDRAGAHPRHPLHSP